MVECRWAIGRVMAAALAVWPLWAGAESLPPSRADQTALARFKGLDRQTHMSLDAGDLAIPGAASKLFTILDRNGNGVLTAADGAPAQLLLHQLGGKTSMARDRFATLPAVRIIAALDLDQDDRLSLAELRPSLAGNVPLDTAARPARPPDAIELPPRPQPCWIIQDHTGRWVELPASAPACRMR